MCAIKDLCYPLSSAAIRCSSVRRCTDKTTGIPLCQYCLRRQQAGWPTPPGSEKSLQPLLSLTKSYQPKYLTSCTYLAIYSPSSSGISFIWGQGRLAQAILLREAVIDSPHATFRRGGVWNIVGVGWGVTESKRFALLSPCHPPPPSSLSGDTTAAAYNLRGGRWGVAATPPRLGASSPPLACMCTRLGPGWQHHLPPLPLPAYTKTTLIAHDMSTWSPPGGYGT